MTLLKSLFSKKLYKVIKALALVICITSVVLFGLAQVASHGAGFIFNQAMTKQHMLKGTITVDTISANAWGRVSFENLVWSNDKGEVILAVPEGSFKVSPWDIIRRQFKSTTVQEINLTDATIAVRFDRNMQLDFVKPTSAEETNQILDAADIVQKAEGNVNLPPSEVLNRLTSQIIEQLNTDDNDNRDARILRAKAEASLNSEEEIVELEKVKAQEKEQEKSERKIKKTKTNQENSVKKDAKARQAEVEKRIKNFNWEGQKLNVKIHLDNCQIEVFQRHRHYVMTNVNTTIDLNTDKQLKLDFISGNFAGTAIGKGVTVNGVINLNEIKQKKTPTIDMDIAFLEVDPSSLGFGDNIHDKMTLTAHAQGEISHPIAIGHIEMPRLRIPALMFTDVRGEITYYSGQLEFKNVTADVYNGKLSAYGDYNIDTRVYNIYGYGRKLDSRVPSKKMEFQTLVDLNLTMKSNGHPHDLWTYGSFQSGEGHYSVVPFNSISGEVSNHNKDTDIYNVLIKTDFGDISTDAFHIVNGNLKLGRIKVQLRNGQTIFVTEDGIENQKIGWKEIQANIHSLQDNVKSIQNNTMNLKNNSANMSNTMEETSEIIDELKSKADEIKNRLDNVEGILAN